MPAAGADPPKSTLGTLKKAGTIKVRLNMAPKLYKLMIKPFMERYPFAKIEYTRGVGAGRAMKPLVACKAGRHIADIVGGFGSSMEDYLKENALEPIGDPPAFASVRRDFKNKDGP